MIRFLVALACALVLAGWAVLLTLKVRRLEKERHGLLSDIILHGSDIAELETEQRRLDRQVAALSTASGALSGEVQELRKTFEALKESAAELDELQARSLRQEELFTQGISNILGYGGEIGEVNGHGG